MDNDNNVDVSVYQRDVKQGSCGTLQLTYGLEQSDQIYTLICNTEGDTVKLSKNTGFIAVSEVVVTSTGKLYCTKNFFSLKYYFGGLRHKMLLTKVNSRNPRNTYMYITS